MEKDANELTPAAKRERRFEQWLAPAGAEFRSPAAAQTYRERTRRVIDVLQLREPDRVPVMLPVANFPIYNAGGTLQKAMYDYGEIRRAWLDYINTFDTDIYRSPVLVLPGAVFESLDYKLYKWPGHGLGANAPSYQAVEGEYMMADEYDALIEDPSDFWMRVYLPRVFGAFEPFRMMAPFTTLVEVPIFYFLPYMAPPVQDMLQKLVDAGRETARWFQVIAECDGAALAAGFPSFNGGAVKAPFDVIGDTMRGTQGIMMDMYRQPEKLLKAMERIVPLNVKAAVAATDRAGGQIAQMYLHKGSDGFMSPKQFEKFYWPPLREVIMGLVDAGIVPMLFAEGNYDSRLEIVKDLPEGSVLWWFDQTDMAKAKQVLGDSACIAGNVPTSMLCTGTPPTIKEYCRRLIETVGAGGGFILTGGALVDNAPAENLRAMMEAAREYGVY